VLQEEEDDRRNGDENGEDGDDNGIKKIHVFHPACF
jgi:hypothetical protein